MICVKVMNLCIATSKKMILQFTQHIGWVCFVSFLCSEILKCDAETHGNLVKARANLVEDEDSVLCPSKNSKFPVYLPHPSDCNKFYICDNGSPHLKHCFHGLHFNQKINACDFPENVKCNSGDIEKPKGKLIEDEDYFSCPAENSEFPIYLPHPVDCNKFYICDNGFPYLKDCQQGLHFNPKIKACDFPANANCNIGDVENPNDDIIDDEDSDLCPVKNSKFPTYLPHPSDCSKFYICDTGSPHLKQCHPGLHFSPKINACDYPENAMCSSGDLVKPKAKLVEDEDFDLCPAKNSKFPTYLPDPSDCSKFYICDTGSPHLKQCLPGLHFNPKINTCDYPENAKCNAGDLVKPKAKLVVEDDDSSLCPAKNSKFPVYLPHPSDCNKFYICDAGSPHLIQCHAGLHFNPKINACDYPKNAKCNNDNNYSLQKGLMKFSPGIPSPYCPSVDGKLPIFYRHSSNCSVYYMCGNGLAYQFVCPARLHFNLRKRMCDYEITAGCATTL